MRQKLPQPTPEDVRSARKCRGLSQTAAGQLVTGAGAKAYRTWQRYEAPVGSREHRKIPIGLWELFLLLTDQHPTHKMIERSAGALSQLEHENSERYRLIRDGDTRLSIRVEMETGIGMMEECLYGKALDDAVDEERGRQARKVLLAPEGSQ